MTCHRALLTADPPIPPPKMSGLSMLAPPPAPERAALAAKAAYRSQKTALPADELIGRVRQCRSPLHVALRDRIHTLPPGRTGTPRHLRRGLWVATPARPAMATYYSLNREHDRAPSLYCRTGNLSFPTGFLMRAAATGPRNCIAAHHSTGYWGSAN